MKKLFLIAFILVFATGCSSTKSVLGPVDDNDNTELADVIDDINAEYEHERNMADDNGDYSASIDDQLEEEFGGEDMSDILDDFEKQVQDDLDALDKQIADQETQDAIDEFAADLEHDINMLDEQSEGGDMREAMDDFEKQVEKDLAELDKKIQDQEMQDIIDDFEDRLERDIKELDERIENNFIKEITSNFEKQLAEDLMDTEPEEKSPSRSCNSIAKMSTCIDYIGSFWTETQMKYACQYSGTLSPEPCETGSIGGCNVGKGSFNDMIIWMYSYGGAPIAADSAKSAKPACDMNPMGNWVNAR